MRIRAQVDLMTGCGDTAIRNSTYH